MSYSISPTLASTYSPIQFEDDERDTPLCATLVSRAIFKPKASSCNPSPAASQFSSFTASSHSPFSPRITAQSPFTPITYSVDRCRDSAKREDSIQEEEPSPFCIREKRTPFIPLQMLEHKLAEPCSPDVDFFAKHLSYDKEPLIGKLLSLSEHEQHSLLKALTAARKFSLLAMDSTICSKKIISYHLHMPSELISIDLIDFIYDELSSMRCSFMETSAENSSFASALQALSCVAPYFEDSSYLLLPLYDLLQKEYGSIPKSILLSNESPITLIEKLNTSL